MLTTRNLDDRHKVLLKGSTIKSQLPITFDNGNKWTHFEGSCVCCNLVIEDDQIFGELIPFNEKLVTVEAVGVCKPCNLVTPFLVRLHSDMTISAPINGIWERRKEEVTFIERFFRVFMKRPDVTVSTKRKMR